jgi:hypothetical protein
MMMMTEEKHTPNAVSFVIEMPATKVQEKSPEIKKRLEDQSAAHAPMISLEQIQAKLEKAELLRRASMHMPQSFEMKRSRVNERKSSLEQAALEHNTRIESTLSRAEKNREMAKNNKMMKVQEHLNKVDEVRKQKSIKEESTLESKKDDIKMKLEAAEMRRQTMLNHVIDIAQKSAEKRKPSVEQAM